MRNRLPKIFLVLLGLKPIMFCAPSFANIIAQGDTAVVCALKFPFVLNATPGLTQYQWSNGSVSNTATVQQPGTYWVTAVSNGMILSDTIVVMEKQLTTEILSTDKTFFCETDTPYFLSSNEIFDPLGFWNNGTIGTSIQVYQKGKYWFTAIDSSFCLKQVDTVELVVIAENSILNFSKQLVVCSSAFPVELSVELGDAPLWIDSTTDYFFQADTPGVYWYQAVFGNCATIYDTITLAAKTLMAPTLCCDTVVCSPDTVFLSLPAGYVDYYWSTGQNQQNIFIAKVGDFNVSVIVTDSTNCSAETNAISVQIKDSIPPLSIAQNGAFLVVQPAGFSYQWFRNDTLMAGETTQAVRNNIPGVYCVRVSQGVCFDTVCFTFMPNIPSSVGDEDISPFQIYPNPVSSFLHIATSVNSEILVKDVFGITLAVVSSNKLSAIIDVSLWSSGFYFVCMPGHSKTLRFFKH